MDITLLQKKRHMKWKLLVGLYRDYDHRGTDSFNHVIREDIGSSIIRIHSFPRKSMYPITRYLGLG